MEIPSTVPKRFQIDRSNTGVYERTAKWIKKWRDDVAKDPVFPTKGKALSYAVEQYKKNPTWISVWKQPSDVGTGFSVVSMENREFADNTGYVEVVEDLEIHRIAFPVNDNYDTIEEV